MGSVPWEKLAREAHGEERTSELSTEGRNRAVQAEGSDSGVRVHLGDTQEASVAEQEHVGKMRAYVP